MSARIRDHIRSNVVGYISIFLFAIGGTAYATHPGGANTISSGDIQDNQVFSADVRNDTLSGGGLVSADVRNDTQTSPAGGLGAVDLKPSSVGTSEVAADSLAAGDLAAGSVGSSEVAADSLNGTDINESSLAIAPTYSGRINGVSPGDGTVGQLDEYGTVTGLSTANPNLEPTQVLSSNRPVTISDLSIRQTGNNGLNGSRNYAILDDGGLTGVGCTTPGMGGTTCDSGSATATVGPGSALSIQVVTNATTSGGTDVMFGFVAR